MTNKTAEIVFRDHNSLALWLIDQPPPWVDIITARACLRCVPRITPYVTESDVSDHLLLVFQGTALGWGMAGGARRADISREMLSTIMTMSDDAANGHDEDMFNLLVTACNITHFFLDTKAGEQKTEGDHASHCFNAADAIQPALYGGSPHNAPSENPASDYYPADDTDMWHSINNDVNILTSGMNPEELLRNPLWPQQSPAGTMPQKWANLYSELKRRLRKSPGDDWDVWLDWYDARLRGDPINQELETARLTLEKRVRGIWARKEVEPNIHRIDITTVNTELRRVMNEHT